MDDTKTQVYVDLAGTYYDFQNKLWECKNQDHTLHIHPRVLKDFLAQYKGELKPIPSGATMTDIKLLGVPVFTDPNLPEDVVIISYRVPLSKRIIDFNASPGCYVSSPLEDYKEGDKGDEEQWW